LAQAVAEGLDLDALAAGDADAATERWCG